MTAKNRSSVIQQRFIAELINRAQRGYSDNQTLQNIRCHFDSESSRIGGLKCSARKTIEVVTSINDWFMMSKLMRLRKDLVRKNTKSTKEFPKSPAKPTMISRISPILSNAISGNDEEISLILSVTQQQRFRTYLLLYIYIS